jgi:hypothetical protein
MAASYHRFYLQRDGHTFAAEVQVCESESDAIEKAKELLALSDNFHLMVVWQGSREVGIVKRGS